MRILFEPLGKKTVIFSIVITLLVFGGGAAVYLALHNVPGEAPYGITREEVQSAVIYYQGHTGELPILNASATILVDGNTLHVIDICKLLELTGGMLKMVPASCARGLGGNNDNCDGINCNCDSSGHYVWAIDNNGGVHSACVGGGCKAYNKDGDQGVWP